MSVNTCLIYRCLSSASAVIRSWFIYELQKSTTIAFSRNPLYTFYSRNPSCGIPPYLRISNRKYPPMPSEFHNHEPLSPSEILKAVRGIVWIFSGIAQFISKAKPREANMQVNELEWHNLHHCKLSCINILSNAILSFFSFTIKPPEWSKEHWYDYTMKNYSWPWSINTYLSNNSYLLYRSHKTKTLEWVSGLL